MRARRRIIVRLEPRSGSPAGIGHNGGPPLDVSYRAWVWRRAHARAWKPPAREIAFLRMRRADQLGLSLRDYTSVLLDRGARLGGIVFAPGAFDPVHVTPEVGARIAALADCRLLVCLPRAEPIDGTVRAKADDIAITPPADPAALADAIDTFLDRHGLAPSGVFLVGADPSDARAAEQASLGMFKLARDYFAAAAAATTVERPPAAPAVSPGRKPATLLFMAPGVRRPNRR